ncbi:MAG: hypothetical protein M5R38_01375 [Candidatus Methylomirabilis sp.]|nr:hypothetical protein [Candidatus Methylomirabilis sp.]
MRVGINRPSRTHTVPLTEQRRAGAHPSGADPQLNELIGEAVAKYPPPAHGKRPVRFHYATQAAKPPPTFLLFVSDPRAVRVPYRRYLVNQLRAAYGFVGAPIRLVLKPKESRAGS